MLEPLSLGQGQTLRAAIGITDPDGDALGPIEIETGTGDLEAVVEDGELVLHASYGAAGASEITVRVADARGGEAEQIAPVEVKPLAWLGTTSWTDGPEAREHGAMFADPDARQAYLIGGSGYDPYLEPLGDAWRYDLDAGTWAELTPTGEVPAAAGSRRVAQLAPDRAYLFGGYGAGNTVFDDLYEVIAADGQLTFHAVEQQNAPPARALHAFVYDPVSERFFVFGGFGQGVLDDLWSMQLADGVAQWTKLELGVRPSPRYGFFYGFDPEHGRLVVFSGAQGLAQVDPAHDTWVLDVRSDPPAWQQVTDEATSPPGRRNGCMVFDPSGPRLWVFGGTPDAMTTAPGTWVFDARPGKERWTELPLSGEPPVRSSGFGVYDEATQRVVLGFGNSSAAVYRDLNALGY